jgi:hypothetical protein
LLSDEIIFQPPLPQGAKISESVYFNKSLDMTYSLFFALSLAAESPAEIFSGHESKAKNSNYFLCVTGN